MSYGILVQGFKMTYFVRDCKTISWQSEANVETLQKSCPYIWVSHKFDLTSVKSVNRTLSATEYWFKALKCQI